MNFNIIRGVNHSKAGCRFYLTFIDDNTDKDMFAGGLCCTSHYLAELTGLTKFEVENSLINDFNAYFEYDRQNVIYFATRKEGQKCLDYISEYWLSIIKLRGN